MPKTDFKAPNSFTSSSFQSHPLSMKFRLSQSNSEELNKYL